MRIESPPGVPPHMYSPQPLRNWLFTAFAETDSTENPCELLVPGHSLPGTSSGDEAPSATEAMRI